VTTGLRRDQQRGWEIRNDEIQARHLADDIIDDSHLNPSVFGAVGQITAIDPDDAAAAGATGKVADAGHQHAFACGTPVSVTTANAEGSGVTAARNDHGHGLAVPAVRAVLSASTLVATATDVAIAFDAADAYDTDSLHNPASNNTRITCNVAGVWIFGGWYEMEVNSAGTRSIYLRLNGTTIFARHRIPTVGGSGVVDDLSITGELKVAATDYVELIANQNSGSSLNVTQSQFWASYRTAG